MAQYYTDFSEYTAGVEPSDFTKRWHAADGSQTWNVIDTPPAGSTGGKAVEHANHNGVSNRSFLSWNDIDADATRANFEILCKVRTTSVTDAAEWTLRLFGRASGTDTSETGYGSALRIGPTFGDVVRIDGYNNATGILGTQANFTILANTWYWLRFRANGTTLTIKAWADGDAEPGTPQISLTDSTISAAGWVGLGGAGGTGTQYFDVFAVGTNGDTAPSAPLITNASVVAPIADTQADFPGSGVVSVQSFQAFLPAASSYADALAPTVSIVAGPTSTSVNAIPADSTSDALSPNVVGIEVTSASVTAIPADATADAPAPTVDVPETILASLYATATQTFADVVNEDDNTTNLHLSVDDDPASPDDADWVNNAVDVT